MYDQRPRKRIRVKTTAASMDEPAARTAGSDSASACLLASPPGTPLRNGPIQPESQKANVTRTTKRVGDGQLAGPTGGDGDRVGGIYSCSMYDHMPKKRLRIKMTGAAVDKYPTQDAGPEGACECNRSLRRAPSGFRLSPGH